MQQTIQLFFEHNYDIVIPRRWKLLFHFVDPQRHASTMSLGIYTMTSWLASQIHAKHLAATMAASSHMHRSKCQHLVITDTYLFNGSRLGNHDSLHVHSRPKHGFIVPWLSINYVTNQISQQNLTSAYLITVNKLGVMVRHFLDIDRIARGFEPGLNRVAGCEETARLILT